ncbi:hypothetical protein E2C01_100214 [Portunus trituberculatus]|uniref:Uncharacterized protein n=1 Tax=Portunus trituberculatus TaxID=210409 RepID=A0A5B7KBF4_PORTR|nr:hypothetical protein [Portunus trituberculatus]
MMNLCEEKIILIDFRLWYPVSAYHSGIVVCAVPCRGVVVHKFSVRTAILHRRSGTCLGHLDWRPVLRREPSQCLLLHPFLAVAPKLCVAACVASPDFPSHTSRV